MPHPPAWRRCLNRALCALLCSLALLPLLLGGSPAWAAAAPASDASMDLYMRLSAINFCLARSIGHLDVEAAVPIAGETVVVILQNEHGSRIKQLGDTSLSVEELRRGAYDSVLLGALTYCPKEIPDAMRQSLETAIKERVDQVAGAPAQVLPAVLTPASGA